ncbi:hypothetical protein PsYK624_041010 [Phanerochaete sordida]|uniref:Uncharacterized protein n=1 Tax=Phanerochaete sordida TaxID=48140 RepID=A0A9P3LBG0_9APHY|nr:hypothetical protein PsYK624_041010 [Phanerochaete sordida]
MQRCSYPEFSTPLLLTAYISPSIKLCTRAIRVVEPRRGNLQPALTRTHGPAAKSRDEARAHACADGLTYGSIRALMQCTLDCRCRGLRWLYRARPRGTNSICIADGEERPRQSLSNPAKSPRSHPLGLRVHSGVFRVNVE